MAAIMNSLMLSDRDGEYLKECALTRWRPNGAEK